MGWRRRRVDWRQRVMSLECHSERVALVLSGSGDSGAGRILPEVWKLLVKESFPLAMVVLWDKTTFHELYDLISGDLSPKAA